MLTLTLEEKQEICKRCKRYKNRLNSCRVASFYGSCYSWDEIDKFKLLFIRRKIEKRNKVL